MTGKRYTVLLVCLGNTCRSPMAEYMLKEMLKKADLEDKVEVVSAGLNAFPGKSPSYQAVEVLKEKGLEIEEHRARLLDEELADCADLILTMTIEHKKRVRELLSDGSGKVFTLKEFAENTGQLEEVVSELEREQTAISEKKRGFWEKHREEIAELKERRADLKKELSEVNDRLEELEVELNDALIEHKNRSIEIEGRLEEQDIPDPFGRNLDSYRSCARSIKQALEGVIDKLRKRIEGS